MRISATLTRLGAAALVDLQRGTANTDRALLAVLNDAGEQAFAVSQRYVPVDTGYLKGSGRLRHATIRLMEVTVGYSAEYAAAVHELHRTKSHYLTRAVDLVIENLPRDAASAIVAEYD